MEDHGSHKVYTGALLYQPNWIELRKWSAPFLLAEALNLPVPAPWPAPGVGLVGVLGTPAAGLAAGGAAAATVVLAAASE